MTIQEIRLLPPLAIARLGSADRPLENYDLVVADDDPLGFRLIRPAETLEVDPVGGAIARAYVPDRIVFRDRDRIRPVAPFLEVFARTSDDVLEPLTLALLEAEGLTPADVVWSVRVANAKALRRTGEIADRVVAERMSFSDHGRERLDGRCANFLPNKVLPLGWTQYVRPDPGVPGDPASLHAGARPGLWGEDATRDRSREGRGGPRAHKCGTARLRSGDALGELCGALG